MHLSPLLGILSLTVTFFRASASKIPILLNQTQNLAGLSSQPEVADYADDEYLRPVASDYGLTPNISLYINSSIDTRPGSPLNDLPSDPFSHEDGDYRVIFRKFTTPGQERTKFKPALARRFERRCNDTFHAEMQVTHASLDSLVPKQQFGCVDQELKMVWFLFQEELITTGVPRLTYRMVKVVLDGFYILLAGYGTWAIRAYHFVLAEVDSEGQPRYMSPVAVGSYNVPLKPQIS